MSALGYIAWHAYEKAGRIDMSECTCEVCEHTLAGLVRFALMSGAADEATLIRALVVARSLPQGV